ncbi:hypothetical protein LTR66_012378, partial [Elasticomyces elasticus]
MTLRRHPVLDQGPAKMEKPSLASTPPLQYHHRTKSQRHSTPKSRNPHHEAHSPPNLPLPIHDTSILQTQTPTPSPTQPTSRNFPNPDPDAERTRSSTDGPVSTPQARRAGEETGPLPIVTSGGGDDRVRTTQYTGLASGIRKSFVARPHARS